MKMFFWIWIEFFYIIDLKFWFCISSVVANCLKNAINVKVIKTFDQICPKGSQKLIIRLNNWLRKKWFVKFFNYEQLEVNQVSTQYWAQDKLQAELHLLKLVLLRTQLNCLSSYIFLRLNEAEQNLRGPSFSIINTKISYKSTLKNQFFKLLKTLYEAFLKNKTAWKNWIPRIK